MLSERKETQKSKFSIILLHEILRWAKLICSDKKQISVSQEREWGVLTVKRHTSMSGQEWQEENGEKGQQPLKTRQLLGNIRLLGAAWTRTCYTIDEGWMVT